MGKYTMADVSFLKHKLATKLGFVDGALAEGSLTCHFLNFHWSTTIDIEESTINVVVTYKGIQFSEDEKIFPSDELCTKIRLLM